MLGFNFLQSENYATYEPFVTNHNKEKFTVEELESLVDDDDSEQNTTTLETTPTDPPEDDNMVMMEGDGVNEEQDIVLVEEDMPSVPSIDPVDEEDLEVMVSNNNNNDNNGDNEVVVGDNEEVVGDNEEVDGDEDEDNEVEGFQGSKSVEYKFMKRVLVFLALFGLSYVLFKMYKLNKHKNLKIVYNKLKRVKIGKLNLDADIVMALLGATAIYLLLRLINMV